MNQVFQIDKIWHMIQISDLSLVLFVSLFIDDICSTCNSWNQTRTPTGSFLGSQSVNFSFKIWFMGNSTELVTKIKMWRREKILCFFNGDVQSRLLQTKIQNLWLLFTDLLTHWYVGTLLFLSSLHLIWFLTSNQISDDNFETAFAAFVHFEFWQGHGARLSREFCKSKAGSLHLI